MAPHVSKPTRPTSNVKSSTKSASSVKNSVKPCSDVKNIGASYANAGKVCLNCLLLEDNRPIIIIWSVFEHLQQVIKGKMEPKTGEAGSKLIMAVGLVVQTLTGIRCGLWLCNRCKVYKNTLETDLELLTRGIMLELGVVPIRILEEENTSEPPEFHDAFPHVDWLKSGYMSASEFSNFSSSWASLVHISTFLKAVASDSSKFLGMRQDGAEWRLRVGSLSEYWSVTRSGCGEDLKINFAGLEKKTYREGFQRLSNRCQEPEVIEEMMLKLSRGWMKGFRCTDEKGNGAKFLHHNLNRLARCGWTYAAAKPALASLEQIISLETRQERVNRKRKLQNGISADNISGVISRDLRELNCFVRHNVQKIHNQQEWSEKAIRALHVKTDLIISLLQERSTREAAQVMQPDQPAGSQGGADVVEVVAGPSNSVRKPPLNSGSELSDVSDDEEMDVGGGDVLSNLVKDHGLDQAGLDAVEPLRDEDLHTPPMANIDETLHQQVEAESRMCETFLHQQEGELSCEAGSENF